MKRLAVFISGSGTNFRSLYEAIKAGRIAAEVGVVVSSTMEAGGVSYSVDQGLSVEQFPSPGKASPDDLRSILRKYLIDYLILAGYVKMIPADVVKAYPRSILNIHPALLPSFGGRGFYGRKVHAAVLESGVKYSGVTVHFVDERYDHGPIVAQDVVPVFPTDTPKILAARILEREHQIYPRVVAALCSGRIHWSHDNIPYIVETE